MVLSHRFISLGLIGALSLVAIPVFAQGIGMGGGFTHFRNEGRRLEISEELQTAMDACHEQGEMADRHECMQAVQEEYGTEFPMQGKRGFGRNHMRGGCAMGGLFSEASEELQAAMNTCKERETREETHECMMTVQEEHADELQTLRENMPMMGGRGRGTFLSEETREEMQTCKTMEDMEERRACMQNIMQ